MDIIKYVMELLVTIISQDFPRIALQTEIDEYCLISQVTKVTENESNSMVCIKLSEIINL